MTNQEKIDELVPIITANGKFLPMCIMSNYQCRSKVMQMAEWKDQQFKEYLEKKLVDISKEKMCGPYGVGCNLGMQRAVNEIIDELFGETEQNNSDREE